MSLRGTKCRSNLKRQLRFLLGNPIPFIPFPLIRGWGVYVREASPPFDSPFKEGGGILERGKVPLSPVLPLPSTKGRGSGG